MMNVMVAFCLSVCLAITAFANPAFANPAFANPAEGQVIAIHSISGSGVGPSIGAITALDTDQGLVIEPELNGLSPGEYGFHLHANGSCDPGTQEGIPVAGLAAGGHWDPDQSGRHLGPFGDGHRGDLSRLIVNDDGQTTVAVVAPRLRVADLQGRALILHSGGDTYSDEPPLGGGGSRMACGLANVSISAA